MQEMPAGWLLMKLKKDWQKVNLRKREKKMEIKNIVLFGVGGSGREITFLIDRINKVEYKYNLLGFIDDDEKMWG